MSRTVIQLALFMALGMSPCALAGADTGTSDATANRDDWNSRLRPVPANATRTRHYYRVATGEQFTGEEGLEAMSANGVAAGGEDDPVYSCTPPLTNNLLVVPGANLLIADDVTTVAVGGCDLEAFELVVGGGGDGSGPGFGFEFALYPQCPLDGVEPIPGTAGSLSFDDDGLHEVLIDFHDNPIPTNKSYYIGLSFDTNGSGWIAGVPATTGFTENLFHHPFFPCAAPFPSPSTYAGFYFVAHCGPTEREFAAYRSANIFGARLNLGDDNWIVDDIQLIGGIENDTCILTSYDVAGVGTGTPFNPIPYTITAELRTSCEPGSVIEGTQRTFDAAGDGLADVAQFVFPDGLELPPGRNLYIAFRYSAPALTIISGEPSLGFTQNTFTYEDGCEDGQGGQQPCAQCTFQSVDTVGFYASVRCLGEAPMGACCDVPASLPAGADPEADLCRNTKEINCQRYLSQYEPGAKCPGTCSDSFDRCQTDADCPSEAICEFESPFDPPCGHLACCLPDPGAMGSCENMPNLDCLNRGGLPNEFVACGDYGQECGWFTCQDAVGDCCLSHQSPGCQWQTCCNLVCDVDGWCCTVDWDEICTDEARTLCYNYCPSGEIAWIDPPSGVVDARQPHALNDPGNLLGIDTIRVDGPPGVSSCCWSLCETNEGESPNFINEVQELTPGEYTLILGRPITPGAVTVISYSEQTTATFTAHPGNVNGDMESGLLDIMAVIDTLNDITPPSWGIYSCDLDHSGACDAADILRVIDLLNGAATFSAWSGTLRPVESEPCGE